MRGLYALLLTATLRLYPLAFRKRFGMSMEEALRDRLATADRLPGPRRLREKTGMLVDLLTAGLRERFAPQYRPPPFIQPWGRGGAADRLGQDVHFAVRSLGRNPGFAVTALATLPG